MARLDSGIGLGTSRTQPTGLGSHSDFLTDGSDSDYDRSRDELVRRIRSSSIYTKLFAIFSQESDKYWMTQLNAIVDSVVGTNSTIFDDLGLSSASGDRTEALYQEAINNMQSLYNEYRSYKNSLPVNQVQQLSAAGINAAVTGEGISSSQLPSREIASGAATSMPSTSSGEFALNVVNGLTSVLSSFADVAMKFRDLDLRTRTQQFNEQSSFAQFKKLLSDDGVLLQSSSWSELDDKDKDWNLNASSRSKALYNAYKEYTDAIQYGPVISQIPKANAKYGLDYSDKYLGQTIQEDGNIRYSVGFPFGSSTYGASFDSAFSEIGQMQVELAINDAIHKSKVGNSLIDEGLTEVDMQKAEASLKKSEASYNSRKASIYLKRLDTLLERSRNNDPIASVELINMMQNADWQESVIYLLGELTSKDLQLVGSTLSNIQDWTHPQFEKVINILSSKF